jgi:putative transposase
MQIIGQLHDVQDTLNLTLEASGLDEANILHRRRLLSDNGPP